MRKYRFYRFLLLVLILMAIYTLLMPAAYAAPKEGVDYRWEPTVFSAEELNKLKQLKMQTEYTSYQPGTSPIQLEIRNFTIRRIMCSETFILERKTSDGWYRYRKLPAKNTDESLYPFYGDGRFIAPRSFGSVEADMDEFLGLLIPGKYRIIKYVAYKDASGDMFALSAEFTIEDTGYTNTKFANYADLTKLPAAYTSDMAEEDGVFFYDKNGIAHNSELMLGFLRKVTEGMQTKIRIMRLNSAHEPLLVDVTYNPKYLNFKVEEDSSRLKNGGATIDARYYSYMVYQMPSPGKVILTNALIKTYFLDSTFTLVENVRPINAVKVSELSRSFYKEDGFFKLFGPNGKDILIYVPVVDSYGARVTWSSEKYGDGRLPLRALNIVNTLYHMEWVNEKEVKIYYLSNSGKKLAAIIDISTGAVSGSE